MTLINLDAPPLDRSSEWPPGLSVTPHTPGKTDSDHGSDAPEPYMGEDPTIAPPPPRPDAIGAAFHQGNVVGAAMSRQDGNLDPYEDPAFRAGLWDEVKGTKYETHYPGMADIANRPAFEARKRQIDMEDADRATLAALPWYVGLPLGIVAGTADVTSLLPGGAFIRSARGTIAIGRSALMTGVAAGTAVGAQEAALHGLQQTRTMEESALNIGTSVFLGGLLGAGGAALMSRAELSGAMARLNRDVQELPADLSRREVFDKIRDQIIAAGFPEQHANETAAAYAAWYATRARHEGKTAAELHAADDLTFRNGEAVRRDREAAAPHADEINSLIATIENTSTPTPERRDAQELLAPLIEERQAYLDTAAESVAPGADVDASGKIVDLIHGDRTLFQRRQKDLPGQLDIFGGVRAPDGDLAQRRANEALRPGITQKPMDEGLFGDTARQTDLVDMARARAAAGIAGDQKAQRPQARRGAVSSDEASGAADTVYRIGPTTQVHYRPTALYTAKEAEVAAAVNGVMARMFPSAAHAGASHIEMGGSEVHGAFVTTADSDYPAMIAWSLNSPDAVATVRHEGIHFLKRMDYFTADEWLTLEQASRAMGWREAHDIDARYAGGSEDLKVEEAIAEAFAMWRAGKLEASGPLAAVMEKIKAFTESIARAVRSVFGDATFADIFHKVETGEIGNRAPGVPHERAEPAFQRPMPGDESQNSRGQIAATREAQDAKLRDNWTRHGPELDFDDIPERTYERERAAWNETHAQQVAEDGYQPGSVPGFDKMLEDKYLAGRKKPFRSTRAMNEYFEEQGELQHAVYLSKREMLDQGAADAPNARVTFAGDKKIVEYFKTADASSGIHELWHLWWAQLVKDADRPGAPQWMRDDIDTVLRHLGVDRPDAMTVEHHEQLSRWGEQYFREGRAPSQPLAAAFAKFKEWLTQIYRDLSGLGTEISPEMRGVFDRALATPEEIAGKPGADISAGQAASAARAGTEGVEGSEQGSPQSAGAAANQPGDLEGNSIAGRMAGGLAVATRRLNPFLRLTQSLSPAVRDIAGRLLEGSVYLKKNFQDVASDRAVETLIKEWNGGLVKALRASDDAYVEYRKAYKAAGQPFMSAQDFRQAVGKAMRRGDQSDIPQVARVAAAWRREVVEPLKNAAIAQRLLPKDVTVDTAPSYFSRMWNRQRLIAQQPRFRQVVSDYYANLMGREYQESTASLNARIARIDREIADLNLSAGNRSTRLDDLDRQIAEHEVAGDAYLGLSEAADNVSDAGAAMRKAKDAGDVKAYDAAKTRREALITAGGRDLKDFIDQRAGLRSQRRNVDLGAAGLAARRDHILDSLADIEEATQRTLGRMVKKGQKLDRDLARLDPQELADHISGLRDQFADLGRRADAAQDQAVKGIAAIKERAARLAEREDAAAAKAATDAQPGDPEVENRAAAMDARARATAIRAAADAKAIARLEREAAAQRARHQRMNAVSDRLAMAERFDRDAAEAEVHAGIAVAVAETSSTLLARGERAERLQERLASLDPERIKARVETVTQMKADMLRAYYDRWEIRNLGQGVEHDTHGAPDFTDQAKSIADTVYNTLTGRTESGVRPEFMTVGTRGPMKDRTFNIPDELVEDFLEHDASDVMRRYVRVMGADVEMAKKFGSVDMKDQFDQITTSYDKLRAGVDDERTLQRLGRQERSDKDDLAALRDIFRGTRAESPIERNYAKAVRIANHFNYMRSMGEVVLASLTDPIRIAMVHGLMPYMQAIGQLATNLRGVKMSVAEAQLAGNVAEKYLSHRLATLADLHDPYSATGPVEALMENMANVASKWNGVRLWTDWMKGFASIITQNRILDGAARYAEIAPSERAYLAFLGIDPSMAGRIAGQHATFRQDTGGVKVAGTENWTDVEARTAFRAALNKDVDSAVVQSGKGDVPLFMHTPTGKMLLQFQTFNLASHQRVLMRGLQESPARFVSSMIAMAAMGMFMTWVKAVSGNRQEKLEDITRNPGWWIGEGLDRSGIFSVPMEIANRFEKMTGFNPIKSPMKLGDQGQAESQKNQNRNELGSFVGPTGNLVQDILTTAQIPKAAITGQDISKAQGNAAIRLLPYNSYYGVRQMLNYVIHPPH